MKKLLSTKNMTRQEWLEERLNGVFGSEASIILGINKYKSALQLWEEKTGRLPVKEEETTYTHFGNIMEPIIRKEFTKRHGLKVRMTHFILQSDEYPWMRANIDGIVTEADGSKALFEAKTATEYSRDVWEKGVPDIYYAQIQHYLSVTGFRKAYVCAVVGGNTFYCHEVYRDEAFIQMLIQRELNFWNCVILDIMPEVDGAEATTKYLNQRYAIGEKTSVELASESEKLAEEYLKVDEEIKRLSNEKAKLANGLKELMKTCEKGLAGKYVVKWPTISKKTLDSDKVKLLLGNSYDEYLTESTYRRFSVA